MLKVIVGVVKLPGTDNPVARLTQHIRHNIDGNIKYIIPSNA